MRLNASETISGIAVACQLLASCGGGGGGTAATPPPPGGNAPTIDRPTLEALITGPGQYLTFMCTPWGSGMCIGVDRDSDGILNGDE
jgi:hypothetical protein